MSDSRKIIVRDLVTGEITPHRSIAACALYFDATHQALSAFIRSHTVPVIWRKRYLIAYDDCEETLNIKTKVESEVGPSNKGKPVRLIDTNGHTVRFDSMTACAAWFGIARSTIYYTYRRHKKYPGELFRGYRLIVG